MVSVISAPDLRGSAQPLTGLSVTSTTPRSVSTSTAAVVSCGSCTELFTESVASTELPCTWTAVTDPTFTPATMTSVPFAIPAALTKRALTV